MCSFLSVLLILGPSAQPHGEYEKIGRKEHIRSVKNCKKGSNIAKHAWDLNHRIDFNNGKVIDSGNYRTRKTLESWHTAVITNSDNNSKPLPKQYATLVRKTCNR